MRRERRSSVQRYRDAYAQRDLARELEELSERAYPALTVLELDGWLLRAARGFTRRANSAWPRAAGDRLGLDRRLEATARFYRQRRLPPAIAVSPSAEPRGLDRALAERGWAHTSRRAVQTARLESVLGQGRTRPAQAAAAPPAGWLEAWSELSGGPATDAAAVLSRVSAPTAYAVVAGAGRPVGVARGVADGGWLGIFDLHTTEPRAEAELVRALATWAARSDAEWVYRHAATTLPGFRTAYEYRYRVLSR